MSLKRRTIPWELVGGSPASPTWPRSAVLRRFPRRGLREHSFPFAAPMGGRGALWSEGARAIVVKPCDRCALAAVPQLIYIAGLSTLAFARMPSPLPMTSRLSPCPSLPLFDLCSAKHTLVRSHTCLCCSMGMFGCCGTKRAQQLGKSDLVKLRSLSTRVRADGRPTCPTLELGMSCVKQFSSVSHHWFLRVEPMQEVPK